MKSYILRLNKIVNYIGNLGELLFEEFLRDKEIFVLIKKFRIHNYKKTGDSIRVDYVLSKYNKPDNLKCICLMLNIFA